MKGVENQSQFQGDCSSEVGLSNTVLHQAQRSQNLLEVYIPIILPKFIYSVKASKFGAIFRLLLTLLSNLRLLQSFVALSKKPEL